MNNSSAFTGVLVVVLFFFVAVIFWSVATHMVRREAVDAGVAYFQATEYGGVEFKWKVCDK